MKQAFVSQWVKMFKEIGLTEQQMSRWHHIFEMQHPAKHQSFLEWLQIEPEKIAEIRKKYSS